MSNIDYRKKYESLRKENDIIMESYEKMIAQLTEEKKELQDNNDLLEKQIAIIKNANEKLAYDNNEILIDNEQLQGRVSRRIKDNETKRKILEERHNKIVELNRTVRQRDKEIDELKRSVRQRDNEIVALKESVSQPNDDEIAGLKTVIERQRDEIQFYKNQILYYKATTCYNASLVEQDEEQRKRTVEIEKYYMKCMDDKTRKKYMQIAHKDDVENDLN